MPDAITHVLEWFWTLHSRRQSGMEANPISYLEIQAWINLTRTQVLPEEIDAIVQMDAAYLSALSEERQAMREDRK